MRPRRCVEHDHASKAIEDRAFSDFSPSGGRAMEEDEATLWDSGWNHRGLGNATSRERVYLQFTFAPYWMVVPDPVRREWNGIPEEVQRRVLAQYDDDPWTFVEHVQGGKGDVHGLNQEYNAGVSLHDGRSPLRSWIRRLMSGAGQRRA